MSSTITRGADLGAALSQIGEILAHHGLQEQLVVLVRPIGLAVPADHALVQVVDSAAGRVFMESRHVSQLTGEDVLYDTQALPTDDPTGQLSKRFAGPYCVAVNHTGDSKHMMGASDTTDAS
ncbi:MAG TPA: hypothetical protein VLG09_03655 [Candidatus Saccharimonadales bacterium]|nr:hypothetical protein [Candidatus Saccharimonadales bacterium]